MRITLGYDRREYAAVCGTQPVLRTWQHQKFWSQKSPLVISANTRGKGSPERPQIRDDDGVDEIQDSGGSLMEEGMQDREILESAKSPASRQLWVQAGLCVCVRGSGAALSKLRSTHGDVKLAF